MILRGSIPRKFHYDPLMPHRRTIRLRGWDYSADGTYFVTVCTNRRAHLPGEIVDSQMRLNAAGIAVADSWRWLSAQYPYVVLDEWCVMPNHLHGVLTLTGRGGSRAAPTRDGGPTRPRTVPSRDDAPTTPRRKPIGQLIGAFKTVSTKQINLQRKTPGGMVWQRNFWERVVRDATELDRIRVYIRDNPTNWAQDELNDETGAIPDP